jgi:hypothetical protein
VPIVCRSWEPQRTGVLGICLDREDANLNKNHSVHTVELYEKVTGLSEFERSVAEVMSETAPRSIKCETSCHELLAHKNMFISGEVLVAFFVRPHCLRH